MEETCLFLDLRVDKSQIELGKDIWIWWSISSMFPGMISLPGSGFYLFVLYSLFESYVLNSGAMVFIDDKKGPEESYRINKI